MNTNHTPTPWKYRRTVTEQFAIYDEHDLIVCWTSGCSASEADRMAQIVACVNAHDALTARVAELEAALRDVVAELGAPRGYTSAGLTTILRKSRAALAKGQS